MCVACSYRILPQHVLPQDAVERRVRPQGRHDRRVQQRFPALAVHAPAQEHGHGRLFVVGQYIKLDTDGLTRPTHCITSPQRTTTAFRAEAPPDPVISTSSSLIPSTPFVAAP